MCAGGQSNQEMVQKIAKKIGQKNTVCDRQRYLNSVQKHWDGPSKQRYLKRRQKVLRKKPGITFQGRQVKIDGTLSVVTRRSGTEHRTEPHLCTQEEGIRRPVCITLEWGQVVKQGRNLEGETLDKGQNGNMQKCAYKIKANLIFVSETWQFFIIIFLITLQEYNCCVLSNCHDSVPLLLAVQEVFTIYLGPKKVVVLAGYKTVKDALVNYSDEFGDRD